VTDWIRIHPIIRTIVRQPRSADLEYGLFRLLDIVDHDIDMELLRTLRVGPSWFAQIRHSLEGQTMTVRIVPDHDPAIALALYPHSQQPHVEVSQRSRVRAINHGMFVASDHRAPVTPPTREQSGADTADRSSLTGVVPPRPPARPKRSRSPVIVRSVEDLVQSGDRQHPLRQPMCSANQQDSSSLDRVQPGAQERVEAGGTEKADLADIAADPIVIVESPQEGHPQQDCRVDVEVATDHDHRFTAAGRPGLVPRSRLPSALPKHQWPPFRPRQRTGTRPDPKLTVIRVR
jgi:hypothetical protein